MNESGYFFHRCTDRARRIWRWAFAQSSYRVNHDIQPADLFDALTHGGGVSEAVLRDMGYPVAAFPENLPAVNDALIGASKASRRFMAEAEIERNKLGHHYIGTEHLLLALTALHPEVFVDASAVSAEVLSLLGRGPECA